MDYQYNVTSRPPAGRAARITPRETTATCDKCGARITPRTIYQAGFVTLPGSAPRFPIPLEPASCRPGVCPDGEHLHKLCPSCGYGWIEACDGQALPPPLPPAPPAPSWRQSVSSRLLRLWFYRPGR